MSGHSMLHDWLEWMAGAQDAEWNEYFSCRVAQAVVFHVGQVRDLPPPRPGNWVSVCPPYASTVLEFDADERDSFSHALMYIEQIEGSQDGFMCVPAQKRRDSGWVTGHPVVGVRDGAGEYEFKSNCPEHAQEALMGQWRMAAHVFDVMRCVNVSTVENPAPERLNAKRAMRGKVPIFSFKTLALTVPNVRRAGVELGGTHASPRVHLRRGHIRQLGDGRAVWVQSCVVGSKHGVIHKDYRLAAKAAAV